MTTACQHRNPFLSEYDTPFHAVPFEEIRLEDYPEALDLGLKQQEAEVAAIAANPEAPDFENTIVALERSGALLDRVTSVLFNLTEAETNDDLDSLANRYSPLLTEASNRIFQNTDLWKRVQAVYEQRESLRLDAEDTRLLDNTYQAFVRSGASFNEADKQTYTQLSSRLSSATLTFGQNVLKETNAFEMLLQDSSELEGLPDDIKTLAREKAQKQGREGWLFDLSQPSYYPFLRYSRRRDLRERMYRAYNSKAFHGGPNDNRELLRQIVNDRLALAQLFGQPDYATHRLQRSMASDPVQVYRLLDDLRDRYLPAARAEFDTLQTYARQKEQDAELELQPWDWAYYSEQLKVERFAIDDQMLKPYFELERVKQGIFWLAGQLYGLQFKRNDRLQKYHPDVEIYEVYDGDGAFMALFYADFFPRSGKQGGAWMTEFRSSWRDPDGSRQRPLISIVLNCTPPVNGQPALLTFDEVTTFLHEFGHALHGMLSDTRYASLSGTNVYRDFVEMPSQLMENFACEPVFLQKAGIHYQTGETIPAVYVERIKAAHNYHAAYSCIRQLGFGYLDMAWHTLKLPYTADIEQLERQALAPLQFFPPVEGGNMSVQFTHLFSGGYAAGYYSYKWSEVLDADAYSVLKAAGLFDTAVCSRLRTLLSKGGTEHPLQLYRAFAGRDPRIEALLIRDGIAPGEP
ncbi:MAG: M3 family metallopeptidase [Paludibacteraceae bacterium]|nr:M3 family metallopeptidase [Paludibacteraceae bacterium]